MISWYDPYDQSAMESIQSVSQLVTQPINQWTNQSNDQSNKQSTIKYIYIFILSLYHGAAEMYKL